MVSNFQIFTYLDSGYIFGIKQCHTIRYGVLVFNLRRKADEHCQLSLTHVKITTKEAIETDVSYFYYNIQLELLIMQAHEDIGSVLCGWNTCRYRESCLMSMSMLITHLYNAASQWLFLLRFMCYINRKRFQQGCLKLSLLSAGSDREFQVAGPAAEKGTQPVTW